MKVKMQKFFVYLVGHAEALDFTDNILQCFRDFQCIADFLCVIREAAPVHIEFINNGKEARFSGFLTEILPQIPELCRQFLAFIVRHLCRTVWGEIFSLLHKGADTAFHLCPGQAQAFSVISGRLAAVDGKPVFIEPYRIRGTVHREATPAGAIFLGQIRRHFIRRDLRLIPGIDTKCAGKLIGSSG